MRHCGPGPAARHGTRAPEERSLTARFIGSFPRADAVLPDPLPEVAFVGRSNVGKSSLLNALMGQRLARVSATPGKTTTLNVYEVVLATRAGYLLDLPGYGYARASQADRSLYRKLVMHVVERPRLVGVVWLLDIRRDPSPDDLAMKDVFAARSTRVLAAVTKSDKLPRGQRLRRVRALQDELLFPDDQLVVTSAQGGEGISELREAVAALTEGANE